MQLYEQMNLEHTNKTLKKEEKKTKTKLVAEYSI